MKLEEAKSILITGGTGSFGKKFTQKILEDYPQVQKTIIFSRDEYKQFHMANSEPFKNNDKLRFFIGDVRDKDRLSQAFGDVDIVIHAAALKHVPICEYNPFEAIKTNIIGAQNVASTAIEKKVKKVIALSTDKACSPINLYGATKLCSDKLFIAAGAYVIDKQTTFSVVRYGNVASSRGSVIPYFKDLLAQGVEELPITDNRMTRFWLNLDEAVEMVINAIDQMEGGELFVRKIPSMKITDLAQALAPNIKIKEIGIRPGEKIHEMMISAEDSRNTIELDKFYIILPGASEVEQRLKRYGKIVANDFEYHSGNNSEWLSIEQMKQLIKQNEEI